MEQSSTRPVRVQEAGPIFPRIRCMNFHARSRAGDIWCSGHACFRTHLGFRLHVVAAVQCKYANPLLGQRPIPYVMPNIISGSSQGSHRCEDLPPNFQGLQHAKDGLQRRGHAPQARCPEGPRSSMLRWFKVDWRMVCGL